MKNKEKEVNVKLFEKIAQMSYSYVWPSMGHFYNIVDGIYIASSTAAYDDLKRITPASFHKRIKRC